MSFQIVVSSLIRLLHTEPLYFSILVLELYTRTEPLSFLCRPQPITIHEAGEILVYSYYHVDRRTFKRPTLLTQAERFPQLHLGMIST